MSIRKPLLSVAGVLISAATAIAHETATKTGLTIDHPWARPSIPGARVSAAYMDIINDGDEPDALISVEIEGIERVEVHNMEIDSDVMRMTRLDAPLVVPVGAMVSLQPGGLHIMLMGLSEPMVDGQTLNGTLVFEKSGELDVMFEVEPLTRADRKAMAALDHSGHDNADESSTHGEM